MLDDEIAVVGLSLEFHIVDDAALGESGANAGGLEYADLQILELGIVKAAEFEALVVAISEHVRRLIDRKRGEQPSVSGRHVEHDIAHVLIEGLPGQTALDEGTPGIDDPRAHGLAEKRGELVLEPLLLDVGEGHVAGVGAYGEGFELLGLIGRLGRGPDGDLLARRELVEFLAEVSLDLLFGRVGGQRDE